MRVAGWKPSERWQVQFVVYLPLYCAVPITSARLAQCQQHTHTTHTEQRLVSNAFFPTALIARRVGQRRLRPLAVPAPSPRLPAKPQVLVPSRAFLAPFPLSPPTFFAPTFLRIQTLNQSFPFRLSPLLPLQQSPVSAHLTRIFVLSSSVTPAQDSSRLAHNRLPSL